MLPALWVGQWLPQDEQLPPWQEAQPLDPLLATRLLPLASWLMAAHAEISLRVFGAAERGQVIGAVPAWLMGRSASKRRSHVGQ